MIELVIKIPEEVYEMVINTGTFGTYRFNTSNAIRKGIPLPEGHGRLIDADALLKKHPEFDTYPFPSTTIDNAPPIIEADKAGSEE